MDFSTGAIIAGVLAVAGLAAGGGLLLSRARRAGLALHRQLDVLREESAAERTGRAQMELRLRAEINLLREHLQQEIRTAAVDISPTRDGLAGISGKIASLSSTIADLIVRRTTQTLLVDHGLVESYDDQALAALAESIATLRPLVPYPRWRTDADLNNSDLAYQTRRWFWQYFNDRKHDVPIVLPWHYGTSLRLFLGNDISAQIYIAGCMEPNEFAFLDRVLQPGMVFFDIGANDGVYTVFAARRIGASGAVWAFEPSRRELDRLHFNMELNHLAVRIFPLALADTAGEAELVIGGFEHAGHNTLGAFAYPDIEVARREVVELQRLDDVVDRDPPPRIDVIKIDVEGAEIRVLRGAASTLERYRPVLLFEVSPPSLEHQGGSCVELFDFIRSHKYRIYGFDSATGMPTPAGPGEFTDNMIGVPEGKPLPETVYWPWPVPIGDNFPGKYVKL